MENEDVFRKGNNTYRKNDDEDDDERYLVKQDEFDEKYLKERIEKYLEVFKDLFSQIDEELDGLDSYEKAVQIKRSIDNLIESLYSQAMDEDVDVELETTKPTWKKSESEKRIREKRKRNIIENVLTYLLQKGKILDLSHNQEKNNDVHEVKDQIKLKVRGLIFSVIAHEMDPKRRAGETRSENEDNARRYGREAAGSILNVLLQAILKTITAVVKEVAKPLMKQQENSKENKQETSFVKQLEASRNAPSPSKGRSI
ncbi:hypothetical protein [Wolbachia endosymbiont of Pentidionis agamae]|uniref:hypothetical protein n=1 Tax=Wolbachia endosymbiont of Pentidionis agamae TaxID=3110435 RepID=UPI002FD322BB